MTDRAFNVFDYSALDGLAFAAERNRLIMNAVPTLTALEIGPVLELVRLAGGGLLPTPRAAPWLVLNGIAQFMHALDDGQTTWISPRSRHSGFLRTFPGFLPNEKTWVEFGVAAQLAAATAGFPKRIAAQFTAALGEFFSNIHEHSQAPRTGVIAFHAHRGRFEIVASDNGIGVLSDVSAYGTD